MLDAAGTRVRGQRALPLGGLILGDPRHIGVLPVRDAPPQVVRQGGEGIGPDQAQDGQEDPPVGLGVEMVEGRDAERLRGMLVHPVPRRAHHTVP